MDTPIDYTRHFQFPSPTRITGEPTYATLKTLAKELRANAGSVETNLGGGDHGYLGLVVSDEDYAAICATAFVAPTYPSALDVPATATAVQAINLRETYHDNVRKYRECANVERALLRHLQGALDPQYLEPFLDDDTGLLTEDIPVIMKHLFDHYGRVTGEQVKAKEQEALRTTFSPSDPLVTIWNPLEKLKKFAKFAELPYSDEQIIDFALQLIRNTRDFEQGLIDWNKKPKADQTWSNLKQHFKEAQQALKEVRGPSMLQAGFAHANHLAQEMRTEINHSNMEIINMLKIAGSQTQDEATVGTQATSSISDVTDQANSITASENSQLLTTIVQLQKQMAAMQSQLANQNRNNKNDSNSGGGNGDGGGGNKRKRFFKKTPDSPPFTRGKTDVYCWTHGACNHSSADCTRRARGHVETATFQDKQGGSLAFCK